MLKDLYKYIYESLNKIKSYIVPFVQHCIMYAIICGCFNFEFNFKIATVVFIIVACTKEYYEFIYTIYNKYF